MSVHNRARPVWFTAPLHSGERPGHMQRCLSVQCVCVPLIKMGHKVWAVTGTRLTERLRSVYFCVFGLEMGKETVRSLFHLSHQIT